MPIDLSNVNISLQQFQDISSGKYNAGEVCLTSAHTLGKLNHHIHFRGLNAKFLSHEEVLAIKNAFVKALSTSGVGDDELAHVRRDLGLAVEAGAERSLHERSIKPLTRQQVRDILDRNAEAINAHAADAPGGVRIRTSTELYGEGGMRADRAGRRDRVNAGIAGVDLTTEHRGVALAEAVVAGDVDFRSFDESKALLAQVRAQIDQLLETCKGRPSAEREAVVQFRIRATGQRVCIPTGMSEKAFLRKLEAMAARLAAVDSDDQRSVAVRSVFGALNGAAARQDWLNGLTGAPDAGFKVRTAAVQMLVEAGIDDWETLSLVNRVADDQALDFAKNIAALNGQFRGDALRQHELVRSLANLAADRPEAPEDARATIPATSPRQWNLAIRDAIIDKRTAQLPHDVRTLVEQIPDYVRARFGQDTLAYYETGAGFIGVNAYTLVPDNELDAVPLTADLLRERVTAFVEEQAAERYAHKLLERMVVTAGGGERNESSVWNDWRQTRPELRQRLLASRSAAETDAIFAEFRQEIEGDARRHVAVMRGCTKAAAFYRDALAQRLGLPSSCLDRGLEMDRFERRADELAEKIRMGQVVADTPEQIKAVFRQFAEDAATARAAAIEAVDTMNLPPALADTLKDHVLSIDRLEKLDLAATVAAAREHLGALAAALDAALVPNAPKDAVYAAMTPIAQQLGVVVHGLFPPETEVSSDEMFTHGTVLIRTIVYDRPGLAERLAAFFARPDVQGDAFGDKKSPAFASSAFRNTLPAAAANVELAASLGSPEMPPFHAQALLRAFDDAGLGALSVAERMAVLRTSHPAGSAIASAIANAPSAVGASRLREIAVPILRNLGGAAPTALPAADIERFEAALAKFAGGLSEADQARLRTFAETLDFSEARAAASEKALAERLDQICGGGGFDNPSSSASRRALAAGFSLADLPVLARVAKEIENSGKTAKQAIDIVLDPQSNFRKGWAAALNRYTGGNAAGLAELSADARIAIARAVVYCKDDADLLAIVTTGIKRAAFDGTGTPRHPIAIERNVAATKANLDELREAAAGDNDALAAGLELLNGLETRRIPKGYMKYLLDAVRRAPLDAIAKLRRRSSAIDIHTALLQLNRSVDAILRGRDSEGLLEGGDETLACRNFLFRTMISRLTEAQRRNLRDALASQNSAQVSAFYNAVSADEVEFPAMSHALHGRIQTLATSLSRNAGFFYGVVRRSLGEANAPGVLPPLQGQIDLPGIGAPTIFNQIRAEAQASFDAAREAHVRGASPAADAMRGIFDARLAVLSAPEPAAGLNALFTSVTANTLNISIVRGVKQLMTEQNFAHTQFAVDRERSMDVFLPDGSRLSTNPQTAADELSRFVTGRSDAAYATLDAAEKTKVRIVMSLLTQESNTAVIEGPSLALDRQGKTATFSYGGNGAGVSRAFHLDRDAAGGVTVRFETTLRPTHLLVGADAMELAPGSELHGAYTLKFSAQKLDTLAALDFAACDFGPVEATLNRKPPVDQKMAAAVEQLPEPFQLHLAPETTFEARFA